MNPTAKTYNALSRLVAYPAAGFVEAAEQWCAAVSEQFPPAEAKLQPFVRMLADLDNTEIEELYCRTFDNNQAAALEVGWHVYGESYDRGSFLVHMREMMRRYEVAEDRELPDHLSHVLAVLGRCQEKEAIELAEYTALPAVKKIGVSLAAGQNPYEAVMDAALIVLQSHVHTNNGCS